MQKMNKREREKKEEKNWNDYIFVWGKSKGKDYEKELMCVYLLKRAWKKETDTIYIFKRECFGKRNEKKKNAKEEKNKSLSW